MDTTDKSLSFHIIQSEILSCSPCSQTLSTKAKYSSILWKLTEVNSICEVLQLLLYQFDMANLPWHINRPKQINLMLLSHIKNDKWLVFYALFHNLEHFECFHIDLIRRYFL